MDKVEQIGLGTAVVLHGTLFAVLYFAIRQPEPPPRREAVAVTITDNVGLTASATDRSAAAAPRSDSLDRPMPSPSFQAPPQPTVRSTPTPPSPARTQPRPTPSRTTTRRSSPTPPPPPPPATRRSNSRSSPTPPPPPATRRGGSRLNGITDGISAGNSTGTSSSSAPVSSADQSNLISRITRHVRGCYNLGAMGGTAAEDIVVTLRMRPSRTGSITAGQISVARTRGVTGANRQYQRQMQEVARSAVLNCQFPDLPGSMYENGWADVTLNFIPADLT